MKKIIFALTILLGSLFTTNFAFANTALPELNLDIGTNLLKDILDPSKSLDLRESQLNNLRGYLNIYEKKYLTSDANTSTCQKLTQTLWQGNVNQPASDILILQNFLMQQNGWAAIRNKPPLSVTGVYDNATKLFVKFFQRDNDMQQTGSVGPKTLAKINSMICGNETVNQNSTIPASVTDKYNQAVNIANMSYRKAEKCTSNTSLVYKISASYRASCADQGCVGGGSYNEYYFDQNGNSLGQYTQSADSPDRGTGRPVNISNYSCSQILN